MKIQTSLTCRRQVPLFTPEEAKVYVNFMQKQDSLLKAKGIVASASKEEKLYPAEEAKGATADADSLSNIAEAYHSFWLDAFELMHTCLSSEAIGDWERSKDASLKALSSVADELGKGPCKGAYDATRQTYLHHLKTRETLA